MAATGAASSPWQKAWVIPVSLLLKLLSPVFVPLGVALLVLRALFETLQAVIVTHDARAMSAGFKFVPGLVYA